MRLALKPEKSEHQHRYKRDDGRAAKRRDVPSHLKDPSWTHGQVTITRLPKSA